MPEVRNFGLAPGQLPLLANTVTLNQAALVALASTPFEVVPAPGAGLILVPIGFMFIFNFGTIQYQGSLAGTIAYGGSAHDSVLPPAVNISAVVLGNASGSLYASAELDSNQNLAADTNQAFQLRGGSTAFGGPIVTATLGAAGLGYLANDTGTITTGAGDATYKVLTVGAGGAVLTFSVTGAGTRYRVANGVPTATGGAQPGVGTGFTVNITAVQNGDGTLKVVSYYQIAPVP